MFKNDTVEVSVYSSDPDWYVYSKPNWLKCTKDDNWLYMRATSDPLLPRNGVVVLKNTETPELTAYVNVNQKPENTFLNIDVTTKTVESDGICFCVNVSSRPSNVTVTASPAWCEVRFIPRSWVSQVTTPSLMKQTDMTVGVTVDTNHSHFKRTGTITFSNGNLQRSLTVTQLGRSYIWEQWDYEPMHVELDHSGVWEAYTNKEIDQETTALSYLGTLTQPSTRIDKIVVQFTPELDPVDHGDGTPEICSGGQITTKTLDGEYIVKNYNYGPVVPQYEIWIEQTEGGHFTVDSRDWYIDYKEMTDEGTVYQVTALPDTGWDFVEWSDGVSTASRTITVTGDIHIWPVFETSEGIEYDNTDKVEFDNTETALWDNE